MSEHAITLVALDVSLDAAADRASLIAAWLLDEGLVIRNPSVGLTQPSLLLQGPRVDEASPGQQYVHLSNGGVDVIAERELHHPMENYQPPPCPACQSRVDPDEHHALIEEWMAGDEPRLTCLSCGESNLLGNWVDEFTFTSATLRFGSTTGTRWTKVSRTHWAPSSAKDGASCFSTARRNHI